MSETIPAGYWRDGEGRLIPENMVKPIDKARDALVRELVERAKSASTVLADFKAKAFGDIGAFVEMSGEQYGVKLGGVKGNVTLLSFDGRFKIVRQIQEHLVFDERLHASKQLIDGCIQTWTEGSRDEIKALINDAFQVNKEGKINTGRVLGLKRLNINDEKWQRAMQAIADSVQVAGSKPYVRIYERVGDTDQYQPIGLDVAAV
ncbi:sulfate transporter [Pandoraea communis]|uniref:Sulfate transporter n=1 Tax=Pandoraea communis TaxID=2508297 RepID=A0A5E4UBM1_9BURK|nr:DUF3164 family protein [Pandoraea communis]VVD97430.1 sulfate transporter [Pandoraea communis]